MKDKTKFSLSSILVSVLHYFLFSIIGVLALCCAGGLVRLFVKLFSNYGEEIFGVFVLLLISAAAVTVPFMLGGLIFMAVDDIVEKNKDRLIRKLEAFKRVLRRKHADVVQDK